ncbi:MAG: hypothetical protein HEP71_00165 [Roseivirga sp.]|nr:hypothetical protein [Roseivirga sp.]
MKYNGFSCQLKVTDQLISYKASRVFELLVWMKRFNQRVELPMNIVIGYECRQYMVFLKGVVLYIKTGKNQDKVRKLSPINITFVPKHFRKRLLTNLDKQVQAFQL